MFSRLKLLSAAPQLLDALKSYSDSFQLERSWSHSGIHTVHLSLKKDEVNYNSWGIDTNEAVALAKSYMEMVERIHSTIMPSLWMTFDQKFVQNLNQDLISNFMSTTSGCAAHLTRSSCFKNSEEEIVERHSFTEICLKNISPLRIYNNTLIWRAPNNYFVSLAYYLIPDGGVIFGAGAGSNENKAILKAQFELSGAVAWSRNPSNVKMLMESNCSTGSSFVRKKHLLLNDLPAFMQKTAPNGIVKSVDVYYGCIDLLPEFSNVAGLNVTRAVSPDLIPFSFLPLREQPFGALFDSELEHCVVV
ncbi:MAG: hypothetical protein K2P81_16200 [Bacteriovoracaceae bacterium]|nr:hypothetical protein [Bacteriovoracaceae bacterium]